MLFTFHHFIRDIVIFIFIKTAQKESGCKQPFRSLGDFLFRNKSLLICLQQMKISDTAVHITAGLQRQSRRFLRCFGYHMVHMEIGDCPAVGNIVSLEIPFLP